MTQITIAKLLRITREHEKLAKQYRDSVRESQCDLVHAIQYDKDEETIQLKLSSLKADIKAQVDFLAQEITLY